jgi:CRP/FNR family transcriptional regulator, cyclic AMP receptor protein
LFAGLEPEALRFLCGLAKPLECQRGDILFQEGEEGHSLYILAWGKVEVVHRLGFGDEVILTELHAPDFFGEMSILDNHPRSASIRTVEESSVDVILNTDLYHLYQRWPDQYAILMLNMARDLARRLRHINQEFILRRETLPGHLWSPEAVPPQ